MKTRADTELLVSQWRDLLTTVGLQAYPHVMSKDQLLLNIQDGWRVPDLKSFALEQPEVRYFEHGGHKSYASGEIPDASDVSGAEPEDEISETPVQYTAPAKDQPTPSVGNAVCKHSAGTHSECEPGSKHTEPRLVSPKKTQEGGWNPSWSRCQHCARSCTAADPGAQTCYFMYHRTSIAQCLREVVPQLHCLREEPH